MMPGHFHFNLSKTFVRRISKLGANISGETTFVSHILVAQESEVFMATISLNIIPTQTLDGPISPEKSFDLIWVHVTSQRIALVIATGLTRYLKHQVSTLSSNILHLHT